MFVCLFVFILILLFLFLIYFFNSVLSLVGFFSLIYQHKLIFPIGRFEDSFLRGHRY